MPLEPRVLQILVLFVQNPGKLLQKNLILETVWKATFVEESTLSRAVAILRKQLGDDPRAPTFIETVPTLGYRFIAKVETPSLAGENKNQAGAESIVGKVPDLEVVPDMDRQMPKVEQVPATDFSSQLQLGRSIKWSKWSLLMVLLLAAGGTVLWLRLRHRPIGEEKKTIVLSDFDNSTGDSVFDGTLREGLTVQLEQSPILSVVSESRIRNALTLMRRPPDTRLAAGLAREVCQRTDAAAMLDGSIASLGNQYVVTLHATNCITGDTLATEQVQAAKKEDVLRALSTIASNLRRRLGESLASIHKLDTPLEEATTSSLDALKAFSESDRVGNQSGSAAAIPLAQRAVELDPKFAFAWAMLGRLYGDVGQEQSSRESTAKAYEFRGHASDHERFFIVASYEMQVTGNLEKAEQTCETWAKIYPNDAGTYGFRAGMILRVFGQYDKAIEYAQHLVAIHPDFALAYHFLALNDMALGRFEEARRIGDRAAALNFTNPYSILDQYRLAFLAGDEAAMGRVIAAGEKVPGSKDLLASQQASSMAYHGHLNKAREVSEAAVNFMEQSGRLEAAARLQAGCALREAFFGNQEQAKRMAHTVLGLANGRDTEYGAAFALALSGNSAQANALADDLERRFPEDTSVRFDYVPVVRALVALDRHDPAKAIQLLRANIPYELGSPQSSFDGFYGLFYPIYVRGLAYMMMHQSADASIEFRKILDHPGIVANDAIGALAHLQLGRAYVQSGDLLRGKAAYTDFRNLWKTADPGLPIMKQMQLEFAQF